MTYLFLAIAVIAEVVAATLLKMSDEFTRLYPSIFCLVSYVISLYFMTLVLRVLPIGVTYAVWSGIGIVLLAVVGVVLFKQALDWPAVIGMALIIAGIVVMNVFSKVVTH